MMPAKPKSPYHTTVNYTASVRLAGAHRRIVRGTVTVVGHWSEEDTHNRIKQAIRKEQPSVIRGTIGYAVSSVKFTSSRASL